MNKQKFLKSLQSLGGWRERAFILALAERAAPNAMLYFESCDTSELDEAPDLKAAFDALTPGRQRGYSLYIGGAKQPATRFSRIEKHRDRILEGKGIHDR